MLPSKNRLTRNTPCELFSLNSSTIRVPGITFRYFVSKEKTIKNEPKITIIVSKKHAKTAVRRNYIKRIVRNILIQEDILNKLPSLLSYAGIIIGKEMVGQNYDEIKFSLLELNKKITQSISY